MYGSDAGQPVQSLYTKGLSPLCDICAAIELGQQKRGTQHYNILCICEHANEAWYHKTLQRKMT